MSVPNEMNMRPTTGDVKSSVPSVPPIRLAQGKMGVLLAAIAAVIVLMLSISQEKSIIEISHSLVTSIVIFGLLGWCYATAINWHFSSACKRQAEAEPHLRAALAMRTRTLRSEHPDVAWSHNDLATVLLDLGRPADAVPHLEQAVRIYRANDPDGRLGMAGGQGPQATGGWDFWKLCQVFDAHETYYIGNNYELMRSFDDDFIGFVFGPNGV